MIQITIIVVNTYNFWFLSEIMKKEFSKFCGLILLNNVSFSTAYCDTYSTDVPEYVLLL